MRARQAEMKLDLQVVQATHSAAHLRFVVLIILPNISHLGLPARLSSDQRVISTALEMESTEEAKQEPCHFLALPPELRTRIYERIFTTHEDPKECVTIIQGIWLHNADPKPTVLSILATCRQINSEAAGMFYNLNHLYVHSDLLRRTRLKLPTVANSRIFRRGFIETLSAKRLTGITTLSVQVHGDMDEVSGACARIAAGELPRLRVILFTFKPRFCGSVHRDMPREHWWLLRSFRKLPMLTNICFIEVTVPGANGVIGSEGRETLVRLAGELSAVWTRKSGGEKVVQWKFLEEE